MLSRRAAFRLSIMLVFLIGIVYGAARIDRLPPGPRRVVARIGQWLQQQAGEKVTGDRVTGDRGQVGGPLMVEIRSELQSPSSADLSRAIEGTAIGRPSPTIAAIDSTDVFPPTGNGRPKDGQLVSPPLSPETSLAPVSPRMGRPANLDDAFPSQDKSSVLASLASQLQSLGATDYLLEKWGDDGELFRFHCEVAIGDHPDLRRHFEAVAPTGEEAIRRVLAEVTAGR